MAFAQHQALRFQGHPGLADGLKVRFSVAKRNMTTVGTLCVAAFLFVASSRGLRCLAQASPAPSSNQSSDNPQGSLGLGPIAPGDSVDVQVFDAPELSVRTRVGASGDIAVPLLNIFHIAGMTATQAARALEEAFR